MMNLKNLKTMFAPFAALCLFVAGGYAPGSQAQTITPDDVERLLVPIYPPNGQAGRFGSFWRAEFWVRNSAEVPVVFSSPGPYSFLPSGGLNQIDPLTTQFATSGGRPGAMYIVERAYADQVHMSLRIADETRRPVSHGTTIPIIRERDWLSGPTELLDVPTDVTVRRTLRVYDPDATNVGTVHVTIYPLLQNLPLAEFDLPLRGGSDRTLDPVWYSAPSYAEVPDLVEAFPQIAVHERLRVRIEPVTPGLRYWAFITVTDNITQHVTVVTPR